MFSIFSGRRGVLAQGRGGGGGEMIKKKQVHIGGRGIKKLGLCCGRIF